VIADREIARVRGADDVGRACAVDRDPVPLVIARAVTTGWSSPALLRRCWRRTSARSTGRRDALMAVLDAWMGDGTTIARGR